MKSLCIVLIVLACSISAYASDYTDKTTGMEFVLVEGGCFVMGNNNGDEREQPEHEVCLNGFYLGRFEVKQSEWSKLMPVNPSQQKGDDFPVSFVSWKDAVAYLEKLSELSGRQFRLPTEAEWEYAAKSGGEEKYIYSGSNIVEDVGWSTSDSGLKAHKAGLKKPNGSGLYDLSGNVWEWCSDYYLPSYYEQSPKNNPQGPDFGFARVQRGGSFEDGAESLRITHRDNSGEGIRYSVVGFRAVLEAK